MNPIHSTVLLGWTTIARKQIYQIEYYAQKSDHVYCISNDSMNDSAESIEAVKNRGYENVTLISLKGRGLCKIFRVFSCLKKASGPNKIAILAPAGRLSVLYFLFSRILKFKIAVVEWGSIGDIKQLDFLTAFNMRFCYRFAKSIWYKEPFMKDLLHQHRPPAKAGMFFIPNSAPRLYSGEPEPYGARDIDYLWVNRIVDRRYPELMIQGIRHLAERGLPAKSVLMGFLPEGQGNSEKQRLVESMAPASTELLPFGHPFPYYSRAKYFVLIADCVYGNNALLEAMQFGVVPVVNLSYGIELWLKDGENAIVFDKDKTEIKEVFENISRISSQEWERLSRNARQTALTSAKLEGWAKASDKMVAHLLES